MDTQEMALSSPGSNQPRLPGLVSATIVASVTAGVLANRLFRAWRARQEAGDVPDRGFETIRELLADDVLPQIRPGLLELLEGLHSASDEAFRIAEKKLRGL